VVEIDNGCCVELYFCIILLRDYNKSTIDMLSSDLVEKENQKNTNKHMVPYRRKIPGTPNKIQALWHQSQSS